MNKKQWPLIIADEYQRLLIHINNLVKLAYLLHNRAVFGIRNTVLLESLLNLMPCELRHIKHNCLIANQKRTHQTTTKRYPRWVIACLEDTIALTIKITNGLQQINQAYHQHNWQLIEQLTKLIHQDTLKIQRLIQTGPPPKTKEVPTNKNTTIKT